MRKTDQPNGVLAPSPNVVNIVLYVHILMPKWESTLRGPSLPRMIGVVHSCPHCCPQCCHCCQSIHYHCLSLTPCPTTGPVLAATEGLTLDTAAQVWI